MEYTAQLGIEYALLWWLVLEVVGLIALPLTYRLFHRLPDRGYAFAKPFGLLVVSYLLWMLSTLGFMGNTWGNILLALILTLVISILYYRRGTPDHRLSELGSWLTEHRRVVIASELIFAAAFALWTAYKAYDPNIAITEKPMEFAFLNAIMRSPRFPAYDPWMSGYGISYYHFGYIIVATLAKFARVPPSFAFNLGISMLFALTASGAFSLVFNLIAATRGHTRRTMHKAISFGIIAAIMIPLMGNLEGALEFLHANGVGVTIEEPGNITGPFWEWIDVKNLTDRGTISDTWYPTDTWWWWRASRVIHDKGLTGNDMEIIDEFPAFSFLLGDMHPHVLAYPFVFLLLALAFNLLLSRAAPSGYEWGAIYLCLGSLGFLNTWDMPFYFFILVAAYALNRYVHPDLDSKPVVERLLGRWGAVGTPWLRQVVYRAIEMLAVSIALYLPAWLYSLPKAGSGILPNLFNVSRFAHLFLMFGTFFVLLAVLLIHLFVDLWRSGRLSGRHLWRQGLPIWLVTTLSFPVLLALILIPVLLSPSIRTYIDDMLTNEQVQQFLGPQTITSLLEVSLRIRLGLLPPKLQELRIPAGPWTHLWLSLLIAAILFWFIRTMFPHGLKSEAEQIEPPPSSLQFALLMALTGLLLVFSVEFVYLRDAFGTRMNTVFKFYFQAWALLGLSAAFGLYYVLERASLGRWAELAVRIFFVLLFGAGILYPLGASIERTNGFTGPATLDGMAFVARHRPEEYAVVRWLNENVSGHPVIVEAVRGSFAYEHARISSRTGLPAVMGWTGHEGQWHGLHEEIAERERDVKQLYSGSIQEAKYVIAKYNVTYVIVGYLERDEFGAAVDKFGRFMDVAFQAGDTIIYETR